MNMSNFPTEIISVNVTDSEAKETLSLVDSGTGGLFAWVLMIIIWILIYLISNDSDSKDFNDLLETLAYTFGGGAISSILLVLTPFSSSIVPATTSIGLLVIVIAIKKFRK